MGHKICIETHTYILTEGFLCFLRLKIKKFKDKIIFLLVEDF